MWRGDKKEKKRRRCSDGGRGRNHSLWSDFKHSWLRVGKKEEEEEGGKKMIMPLRSRSPGWQVIAASIARSSLASPAIKARFSQSRKKTSGSFYSPQLAPPFFSDIFFPYSKPFTYSMHWRRRALFLCGR